MIGKNTIELDYVDSTNSYAEKLLALGPAEEGKVIWAHEQYAGKGLQDHSWLSEAGKNLTFSLILRPVFLPPDRQFMLNKAISLALVDFADPILQECSVPQSRCPVNIKWPNDLCIGTMKAGGILIENRIAGRIFDTAIIGIGLNINQMDFPDDLPNPTSLIRHTGKPYDIREALTRVCEHLENRYQALQDPSTWEAMDQEYNRRMKGFGEWRPFTTFIGPLQGRITGVNLYGQLEIETQEGDIRHFNHGEIDFVC